MNEHQTPILYSFRRCPYAIRARLALTVTGQTCEIREVVLRDKPSEFKKLSSKATVPMLQLSDGIVLEESLDIMLWALAIQDPQNWLGPDGRTRQAMLDLIGRNDGEFKLRLDRYKYSIRYQDADPQTERLKAMEFLNQLEQNLTQSDYLFGGKLCLADAAIFPFVRQFANVDPDWFDKQNQPRLRKWLNTIVQSGLFQSVMKKLRPWQPDAPPVYFPFTA